MSTEHKTLAEAFTAAQADFPAVDRDGRNPHFRSQFTTLGNLLTKVRPVLNRHGLSVIQLPCRSEDGAPVLRTILLHTSGEQITADAPLMLVKQDPQGQGSAITYMRRYALASALGISDQDDDDGNAGSGAVTVPDPKLTEELKRSSKRKTLADALLKTFNNDTDAVKEHVKAETGKDSTADLSIEEMDALIKDVSA